MLALAGILTYGGFRVQAGGLTLGVVVAFLQYGLRFFRPIQDLSEKYNILQGAMASAERIFKLLDTEAGILPPSASRLRRPQPSRHRIRWRVVRLHGEDWVLRDVSFTIEPGETIAVVGHTGAGKTTLISLLLRFYDVQKGSIRVGGTDIRQLDPAGTAPAIRRGAAGSVPVHRHAGGQHPAGHGEHPAGGGGGSRRTGEPAGLHPQPARGVRAAHPRARQRALHRPEAADQLRPRAGAQSALPDSGRGHFQRGYRNRDSACARR